MCVLKKERNCTPCYTAQLYSMLYGAIVRRSCTPCYRAQLYSMLHGAIVLHVIWRNCTAQLYSMLYGAIVLRYEFPASIEANSFKFITLILINATSR
ncbi:hypothetical protein QQG55_56495 [Brugia pahangi]